MLEISLVLLCICSYMTDLNTSGGREFNGKVLRGRFFTSKCRSLLLVRSLPGKSVRYSCMADFSTGGSEFNGKKSSVADFLPVNIL